MLKKTIEFEDYYGNPRKEDFYFNLSEAEITEMSVSTPGGFEEMIKRIISAQDGATIMKTFKDIILKSYGEKSLDGRRFIKSKELSEAFSQTEAYNKLFMDLVTNDVAASEFVNGIIPNGKQVSKEAVQQMASDLLPSTLAQA